MWVTDSFEITKKALLFMLWLLLLQINANVILDVVNSRWNYFMISANWTDLLSHAQTGNWREMVILKLIVLRTVAHVSLFWSFPSHLLYFPPVHLFPSIYTHLYFSSFRQRVSRKYTMTCYPIKVVILYFSRLLRFTNNRWRCHKLNQLWFVT